MKINYAPLLVLVLSLLASETKAQLVYSTSASYNPANPISCQNTTGIIAVTKNCTNIAFDSVAVRYSTDTVTASLYYSIGPICLGAIANVNESVGLGQIPSTVNGFKVECYLNGSRDHQNEFPISVASCCPVAANFTPPTARCQADTLVFQNTSQGASSYRWYLGGTLLDTTTDLSYSFPSPGVFQVNLAADDGTCTDSISKNITITNSNVDLGPDTTVCLDGTFMLSTGSNTDSSVWSTGATSNSIAVTSAGTIWVMSYTGGCLGTDTVSISGLTEAVSNLGGDTTLCYGDSLVLDVSDVNNASYLWQDGSATPSYTVNSAGLYYVMITSVDGCVAYDSIDVAFDSCGVSVAEWTTQSIQLYPNPAEDRVFIRFDDLSGTSTFEIHNVNGALLRTGSLDMSTSEASVDVSELSSGVYFLRLTFGDKVTVYRFLVE